MPARFELADRLQPGARVGRMRLAGPPRLLVQRGHRDVRAHRRHLGDLQQEVQVAQHERRLGQHRARVARVAQRLPDPAHEPIAALDPLVRVGVGPQRDMLALPRRLAQLGPQHLGHVDLDDDLPLEVPARVEIEVLVRRTGEAVVADDPVGDEITGAGRDVIEPHAVPSGSIRVTRTRRGLIARPSSQHFRLIAGAVRWKKRSCWARPPRTRTVETAPGRRSSTASKPKRRSAAMVHARIVSSPLEIRSASRPHEPSASKIPARNPLIQLSLASNGQATSSRTAATAWRRCVRMASMRRCRARAIVRDEHPSALAEKAVVAAGNQLVAVREAQTPSRLGRRPMRANRRDDRMAASRSVDRSDDGVADLQRVEAARPSVGHENRRVARHAVGAGMSASAIRVDRPAERHLRRLGHAVQGGLRLHLVEADVQRLRRVEVAHDGPIAVARQAGLVLGFGCLTVPAHEHMFAHAADR